MLIVEHFKERDKPFGWSRYRHLGLRILLDS
jgi:hypothetical protein